MASTSDSMSTSTGGKQKKVVLFGRTGDGKSTIANVLVAGGLEPVIFESSDAARGCTKGIQTKSGRGWTVTDTVGLGEADVGTVSNAQARELLIDFLKKVKDDYSHIIYVQKARRITTMEELIWNIFTEIFKGAEDAFVIIITAADPEWLEGNQDKFPDYWRNRSVLTANIPPVHRRPTIEKRLKLVREQSIQQLEADLEKLFMERGNRYSVPDIANMDEQQLQQKSVSLMDYIVRQIKRLFERGTWQKVAAKIATVINVTGSIIDTILLADVVKD